MLLIIRRGAGGHSPLVPFIKTVGKQCRAAVNATFWMMQEEQHDSSVIRQK